MEKKRKIRTYGGYFEAFMETLTEKEQDKIQYGLLLLKTQERLSAKFVKFIRDGVFELRTEYNNNIYRVFSSLMMVILSCCSMAFKRSHKKHPVMKLIKQ